MPGYTPRYFQSLVSSRRCCSNTLSFTIPHEWIHRSFLSIIYVISITSSVLSINEGVPGWFNSSRFARNGVKRGCCDDNDDLKWEIKSGLFIGGGWLLYEMIVKMLTLFGIKISWVYWFLILMKIFYYLLNK